MKFAAALAALLLMLAVGLAAGVNRKALKALAVAIPLPMMAWPQMAVMFFSAEFYRGSTRGMEVALPYLLSFAMTVALTLRRERGRFLPDAGALFFLLYWLLSLPSLVNCHPFVETDLEYTGYMFAWYEVWKVPMMFLVYKAVRGYCRFTDDVSAPLVGLGVVTIVNFLSVLKQHFIVHVAQARGLFAHQNSMAMWALLAGTLFFAAYLNMPKSRAWKYFTVCAFAGVAACMRTYSRGALLCLPIAVGAVALVSFRRNFSFRMVSRLMPLVLMGLLGLTLALPKIVERFESASVRSGEKRIGLAQAAGRMIADRPVIGVGLNNWGIKINPPYEYAQHREEFRMGDDFKEGIVETIYLLVWAECGTPCFLALLALFGWHWWKALRLTRRLRGQPDFWIAAGAFGGLTGVYLQSVLEWVLKQSINFTQLVIVFAVVSYLNEKVSRRELSVHA